MDRQSFKGPFTNRDLYVKLMRFCGLLAAIVSIGWTASVSPKPNLDLLYKTSQWFALRDALEQSPAPAFYRGVVACAFNQRSHCEQDLRAAIRSGPANEQAYQAHNILAYFYLRNGRYKQSAEELGAMSEIRPDDESDRAGQSLFSELSRSPDLVVERGAESRLKITSVAEPAPFHGVGLFVPVTINGKPGEYGLDSGAGLSIISASEARRQGLDVRSDDHNTEKTIGSTGAETSFQIAFAKTLVVGGVRFENVAFEVVPDDRQPFVDEPPGRQAILGIPVLIGLEKLRWTSDQSLDVAVPATQAQVRDSNICFDGLMLIGQASFRDQKVRFVVDTGSESTQLWQPFAKEFSNVVDAAVRRPVPVTGIGGTVQIASATLPELSIKMGSFDNVLRPANILLEKTTPESDTYEGRLGSDFLNRASQTTLDFKTMRLIPTR